MQEEEIICRVRWFGLWKSVAIYGSIAVSIPIFAVFVIHWIKLGFDHEKTFEHVHPIMVIVLPLLAAVFVSIVFLPIALICTISKITISEGKISGRNYWMMKKRIPLDKITRVSRFSSNGINAFVVHSKEHGKVYISDFTENIETLLEVVLNQLPEEERRIA